MDKRKPRRQGIEGPAPICWSFPDDVDVPTTMNRHRTNYQMDTLGDTPPGCGPLKGYLNPRAPARLPDVDGDAVAKALRAACSR